MAGFMSVPSLGFASTVGAAITGAARQGNELMAEQRAQERQDDLMQQQVWMNKADNAVKQWNEENKNYTKKAALWKSLSANGSNPQAADSIMAAYEAGLIKNSDDLARVAQSFKNTTSPPDYKSAYMQDVTKQAQQGYDFAGSYRDRLNPKYQDMISQPSSPFSYDDRQQPTQPQGAIPNATAPSAPSVAPTSGSAAALSNTPTGGGSGQYQANKDGTWTDLKTGQVSNDLPPMGGNIPSVPGNAPAQIAQNNPGFPYNIPTKKQEATPHEQAMERFTQEQRDIARDSQELNREKFEFEKSRKPATFQEQKEIEEAYKDSDKYLHDPKTGLQARRSMFGSEVAQKWDFNVLNDVLTRGFKASKVQDMYDQLNRFTSATIGLDLAGLGVSNTIQDTNTLTKAVSNGIIQRLSGLHFGRITNAEMGMVERGFTNPSTDPSTNMKIVLALKHLNDFAHEASVAEYNAAYPAKGRTFPQRAEDARTTQQQIADKYDSQVQPWYQLHNASATPEDFAKIPSGSWVENTENGKMFFKGKDNKLYPAGSNISGVM